MKIIKKISRFNNEVVFSLATFVYFFLFLFFAFFPLEIRAFVGENLFFFVITGASEIAWVLTVIAAVKYFINGWKKINFSLEDLKEKNNGKR